MDLAPLYRALADSTRRRIMRLLLEHGLCVSALARSTGISESAVSQHLKVLRQAGLLHGKKRGYYMHYDIDREKLRALAKDIEALADTPRQDKADSSDLHEAFLPDMPLPVLRHASLRTLPMAPLPDREN